METKEVRLTDMLAPSFFDLYWEIKTGKYIHYWLKGGRGSAKSTCIATVIVEGIMDDAERGEVTHAIIFRKVGETLKTSVIQQIAWTIHRLGVGHLWNIPKRDRVFTYMPTGQTIRFEGADDPEKIKGITVAEGYFKYVWFEEVNQFHGMDEIRKINQSIGRGEGTEHLSFFYTYNPPESQNNWVNKEVEIPHKNKRVHHSTYLTVPKEWLGDIFIKEAETLRELNPTKYLHEYMGQVTGTGGEVFRNITVREIPDDEFNRFDHFLYGVDFGFTIDPLAFVQVHFDEKRDILYITDEIYQTNLSNKGFADKLKAKGMQDVYITSDVEPRTVNELRRLGIRINQAEKGHGSRDYGFKFLKDLNEIVIDPVRCPNLQHEFTTYELRKGRDGTYIPEYPTTGDDGIDAVRYALERVIRGRRFEFK